MANKGEGSRGGKIIGHTKSGNPIYDSNRDAIRKASASGVALGATVIASREVAAGFAKSEAFKRVGKVKQAAAHAKYGKAALAVYLASAGTAIGFNVASNRARRQANEGKPMLEQVKSAYTDLGAQVGTAAAVVAGGVMGMKGLSRVVKATKKTVIPAVKEEFKFRTAKKVIAGHSSGKLAGLLTGPIRGKKRG